MGIKSAMNAPKSGPYVNEQIRPGGKATFDADALAIRSHIKETKPPQPNGSEVDHAPSNRNWGRFDSTALHIQHALKATEVQRKYSKPAEKPIESYLVSYVWCL